MSGLSIGFFPDSEANGRGAGVYKNRINYTAARKKTGGVFFFAKGAKLSF